MAVDEVNGPGRTVRRLASGTCDIGFADLAGKRLGLPARVTIPLTRHRYTARPVEPEDSLACA